MTAGIPETYGQIGPWQRYVAKERSARNMYLMVTGKAHEEYLTGPWPDRDSYQHVETSAWITYYAAGREAWQHYVREITPPPPPPARLEQKRSQYPVSDESYLSLSQPFEPAFHPYAPESDR